MVVRPCCQCKGPNAMCLHCSCVRSMTTCTHCHTSQSGRCWNILRSTCGSSNVSCNQVSSPTVTLTATCSHMSPDPVSSLPNLQPGDDPHLLSSVNLPSFPSISRVHVFTLHHVPKGTHDMWSGLVTTELNSISSSPLHVNSWCKFMMLDKCILLKASNRHSSWRDTSRIVTDQAKHWSEGDLQVFGQKSLLKSPGPTIN